MKVTTLLKTMLLIVSFSAFGAEPEAYITESGIAIIPAINTGYKYDNNIFSQADGTSSSGIFIISPVVTFLLDDGINNYHLNIGGESGTYISSADDNYLTGNISFKSHLEPSYRSRFDLSLETKKEEEPRGTGLTEGLGELLFKPIQFIDQTAQLKYEYGSLKSNGRIAIMGRYYNKNYTNFSELTQFSSFYQSTLGATFFYSTNSSTDAFFELRGAGINYFEAISVSRDSDVYAALVGIRWKATALTSGSFKIGQEQKKFAEPLRNDFKGISWKGSITWQPLTYSTFTFDTSRQAKDPDVQGDYISESVYGLNWRHKWSAKVTSNITYNYTNEDYSGFERQDKTNDLFSSINYQFKRWADIAFYIELTDKDSTNNNVIYDKNVIGLDITFSL
ncbi:outer membrane beta-barrel protein [Colwellia sp. E2M01]|uniref:outer membrane beta-barrel protein n=1 Tax=Colwellia sp. E2M01 TaxID=2841561 RepID=UPI001C09F721|nr:outer membrane beta-barrel protein [Colwellia sp. E2M01]MBU2870040.1 outer membrane beta-barrel protein [Colwellia sp. E2M01]